jgi:hypothetical protein
MPKCLIKYSIFNFKLYISKQEKIKHYIKELEYPETFLARKKKKKEIRDKLDKLTTLIRVNILSEHPLSKRKAKRMQ